MGFQSSDVFGKMSMLMSEFILKTKHFCQKCCLKMGEKKSKNDVKMKIKSENMFKSQIRLFKCALKSNELFYK